MERKLLEHEVDPLEDSLVPGDRLIDHENLIGGHRVGVLAELLPVVSDERLQIEDAALNGGGDLGGDVVVRHA